MHRLWNNGIGYENGMIGAHLKLIVLNMIFVFDRFSFRKGYSCVCGHAVVCFLIILYMLIADVFTNIRKEEIKNYR